MKLLEMEIENFRQFYGEQNIEFGSSDPKKNITVFHGYNGSGKTALLNAFIWCLYGETTSDLEAPERLENERAAAEVAIGTEICVSVALRFEYHDERYRVQRSRKSVKDGANSFRPGEARLDLWKVGASGELETIGTSDAARQKRVDQILPKALYPFFFFNGERVERLASPDAYDSVESGVKTLLDIEVYERGGRHLRQAVAKQLADDLRSFGDSELKDALGRLSDLEQQHEELGEARKLHVENATALTKEIEDVERKQAAAENLRELATERDTLRAEEKRLGRDIDEARKEIASAISRNGYLAFASPVLDKATELVASARQRGEIPAKIKPQFVDDLLESSECICGRPLEKGSTEIEKLQAWRQATGLADLEENISYLSAQIPRLRDRRAELFSSLDRQLAKLSSLYNERRDVKEKLAIVEEKLGDPSLGEDAVRLRERYQQLLRDRETHRARQQLVEDAIRKNESDRVDVNKQIKKLEVQNERGAVLKRQLEAVERVSDALDAVAQIQKDDVRSALDKQIREIWNDAAIKDYDASVTENYRLLLTKSVGGHPQPVQGASTGEKQVLALSFVGSLVHKARENAGKQYGINVGGHYPLVMDSPFGSLEDDYRAKVAEWIPSLADQVVVMASNTQWRDEVETAMRGRIGREYVLELHTTKPDADRTITIAGEEHPYVVSTGDATEFTVIRKV